MDFEASSFSSPASYSDSSSTPRTPSPNATLLPEMFSIGMKHHPITESTLFHGSDPLVDYPYAQSPSLLQELYDHPTESYYIDDQAHYNEWQQHQQHFFRPHDHTVIRRATFPYVRHDQLSPYPASHLYDFCAPMYHDPAEPSHHQAIKLEDTPLIVPSQLGYSAHAIHPHHHGSPPSYLSPATGGTVAIQHTDDAASKETQYLRRRCFNCHTTEPPSWRRSTLNPGKIVCNKCGLYERTHLRARPLRFDELRAGGKTRKTTGVAQSDKKGPKSPPAAVTSSPQVKKEPREFGLIRRPSVSSSVSSGGALSDWDDSVSVYSSQPPTPGSASGQSSAFPSPAVATFSIPRSSQSPPADNGLQAPIRLPNAPLSDIASLQQQQSQQPHPTPRKAATAPGYFSQPVAYQGHVQCNVSFTSDSPALQASPKTQLLSPPMTSPLILPTDVAVPSS
ncbi:hypothetical protein EDC04DRAFT_3143235 [Pisolithus marmoratus]|nr:hypothetical protein EDC04DRAFT_3143235 [Pisolithus marmoratus]